MQRWCISRIVSTTLASITLIAAISAGRLATATDIHLPAETKVVARIDLGQFSKSTLGQRLLKLTTATAAQEIGTDKENLLAKVTETLGFDPLQEVRTVTVAVSELEAMEPDSGTVVIQMGKTTGNIEGLLLALPGYSSVERDGYTLHCASEGGQSVCGAIHKDSEGNHWIVVSPTQDRVMSLLGSLAGGGNSEIEPTMKVATNLPTGVFASVSLLALPKNAIEDDQPFANVVKSLSKASLSVSEGDDVLTTTVTVSTDSEKRAEQIRQLVQGASAAASLLVESVDELKDNEEMRQAASSVIESLTVEQEGNDVTATFGVPMQLVIKFLQEEADLPL